MPYEMKLDERKVEAICLWPTLKGIHDVRSFDELPSSYRWFRRNFSTITSLVTKVMKGSSFKSTLKTQEVFKEIKSKLA